MELGVEPRPRRCGAEQVVMAGEELPDLPWVALDRRSIPARDAERFERNAARIQHAQDIVIRDDDQRRRLGKGAVLGEEARVYVPVRTDERERANLLVQNARPLE